MYLSWLGRGNDKARDHLGGEEPGNWVKLDLEVRKFRLGVGEFVQS